MRRLSLCLILLAAVSFPSVPRSAQASPLERLHDRVFGKDDEKKDKDKKKKKEKKDDDDDRPRVYIERESRPQREVHIYHTEPRYERRYERRYEPEPRRYYRPIEADVQAALARRGYYYGPIDGSFGPRTRAAIRAYQYDHDLPVTGDIDRYLLARLRL